MTTKILKLGAMTVRLANALGNFLRTVRDDLATILAGDGATADDLAKARDAVVEEWAAACGVTADEILAVERGEKQLTTEQLDALAAVIRKHGLEVTAADLAAMADGDEEEEAKPDADPDAEAEAMRAENARLASELAAAHAALAAATDEVKRLTESNALLTASTPDAEIVKAGAKALAARRADLARRLGLRAKTAGPAAQRFASITAGVATAGLDRLDEIDALLGHDPMTTPLCADCGEKAAVEYRSSEEAALPDGTTRGLVPPEKPNDMTLARAALKIVSQAEHAGGTLTTEAALRQLRTMKPDQIAALIGPTNSGRS